MLETYQKFVYKYKKWSRIFLSIIVILVCLFVIPKVYQDYFTPVDNKDKDEKTGSIYIGLLLLLIFMSLHSIYQDYSTSFQAYKKDIFKWQSFGT